MEVDQGHTISVVTRKGSGAMIISWQNIKIGLKLYLNSLANNDNLFQWANRVTFWPFTQISDVKVMEASPENDKLFKASRNQESFKKALEDNNLFFTENKGRFEAIHTLWEEPLYVTNVKRGILSALQLQFTEKEHTVLPEVTNYRHIAILLIH